jgi:hypothetical protein
MLNARFPEKGADDFSCHGLGFRAKKTVDVLNCELSRAISGEATGDSS